ncbi:MAG: hypothetical protein HRU75_08465 [Planctomycetia bacterium]|nr:MAG: hypothetical protein HRU75_08465 [Planctomycetia bacterium]
MTEAVGAAADAEAGLLEACPRCAYSLRTLPIEHRCPECGLPVDRRWRCYAGRHAPRSTNVATWSLKGFVLIWLGVAALGLVFHLLVSSGTDRLALLAILPILLVVVVVLVYRPRRFIAVGPEGLVVCVGRHREPIRHPWSVLGRAKNDLMRKRVVIERTDGRKAMGFHQQYYFGLNFIEMDRFVRDFNAYPRPAGSGSSAIPPVESAAQQG